MTKLSFEITIKPDLIAALDQVVQRAVKAAFAGRATTAQPEPDAKPAAASATRGMLRLQQVLKIVPVGRNTLMRMIERKEFPKGNYVSPNNLVWYADEVAAWQNALPKSTKRKRRLKKGARK